MQALSLTVSDIDGNMATVVITVEVGLGEGDVDFVVSFNHAPTVNILYESVQSADEVKVAIQAAYFDPEHDPMGPASERNIIYEWDFSDCDQAGLNFDTAKSSPPGDGLGTTVDSNGGETHTFHLSAEDGTESYECVVLISLRDQADPSSSREQILQIRAGNFNLSLPLDCEDFGDCDGDPQNGCETELLANPQHCGACGNACDAHEQCIEGGCVDYQRAEWPLPPDTPTALSHLEAAPGEEVVVDAVTGLMWRAAPPVSVAGLAEGRTHCEGLSWGGFHDWRLPSTIEAMSLVDHSKTHPAFDENIFSFLPESEMGSASYITSTPVIDDITTWSPLYTMGWVTQNSWPVVAICVRGGKILPGTPRYVLGDGGTTVHATRTDLTWLRASDGPLDWNAAKAHCEGLSTGGASDWRLPTAKELLSIVDHRHFSPAIDPVLFPGTAPGQYWSGSPLGGDYHYVDFIDGMAVVAPVAQQNFVRCVRSGALP